MHDGHQLTFVFISDNLTPFIERAQEKIRKEEARGLHKSKVDKARGAFQAVKEKYQSSCLQSGCDVMSKMPTSLQEAVSVLSSLEGSAPEIIRMTSLLDAIAEFAQEQFKHLCIMISIWMALLRGRCPLEPTVS